MKGKNKIMLNRAMQYIKIIIIYFLRIILRVFYIMPINKRKIIFASSAGKQYSCNPKYIFEYLMKQYQNDFTYIWAINNPSVLPDEYKNIKTVKFLSFGYFFHALTAGYVIYNSMVKCYMPYRKNQIVVNTWHGGGAYKKMGIDAGPYKKDTISMKVALKKSSKMVNYCISSCKKFTSLSSNVWTVPKEKYLSIGMPRNDILFDIPDSIKIKVKKYFNMDHNKRNILYAPTYRGDYRSANNIKLTIDIPCLLQALKERFRYDFQFLYRSHIFDKSAFNTEQENVILASDYPDMQELLCISDILITDYSSSIWDFSFTFRPCFIYAPDLPEYKETTSFYTPIEKWPFPLAETNKQLVGNILRFDDEKYIQAVKKHHADLGSYERGIATKQFCETIFNKL